MYLIISTTKTNDFIKNGLSKLDIDSQAMPCVTLSPDDVAIAKLKNQINDFDIVIITSPATIDYIGEVFDTLDKKIIFIVAGSSTYKKLRVYSQNQILLPHNDSGSEAIINQVLNKIDLSKKKIAILRGFRASDKIEKYLTTKLGSNSSLSVIIYHQKYIDLDTQYLKKLLNSDCLQGIILTSSQHALHIFRQAKKFGYYNTLLGAGFITIHPKIANTLQNLGVKKNILVSGASNQSLIDLIGKLHDR